jgi:hypothetical protein
VTNITRYRMTAAGPGTPILLVATAVQCAAWFHLASLPATPHPPEVPLALAAAAVVEPGNGGAPEALSGATVQVEDARLQISFEADRDAWVSVLWFEGPDRVVALYPTPARRETGWVAGERTYVVPSPSSYLRLTPTTSLEGDWLAVVAAARPDPEIGAVLADPDPASVAALRDELMEEARARTSAATSVERFLPTSDGRAAAVTWEELRGVGRLVYGRAVRVGARPPLE